MLKRMPVAVMIFFKASICFLKIFFTVKVIIPPLKKRFVLDASSSPGH